MPCTYQIKRWENRSPSPQHYWLCQASNFSATDSELSTNTDDSSSEEEESIDKINWYLIAGQIKHVANPLQWWVENKGTYPHLWQMARDYLTILGTLFSQSTVPACLIKSFLVSSVAVECVFSKGWLLMSHICNHLSAQSTHTLLCLSAWSKADFVKSMDLSAVATLPDAKDNETWSDDNWRVM